MELKSVNVCFDTSSLHGNRIFSGKALFVLQSVWNIFWDFWDVVEFRFFYGVGETIFNCVVICWLLYVGSPWHLRTMPQTMPAWHIVLANTLGSRQGTLYKAPRNAEVKLQDDNVFCKSDYWNLNACRASAPLPLSHQVYITILISFFWGGGLNNPCCLLKENSTRWLCDTRKWYLLQSWARTFSDGILSLVLLICCFSKITHYYQGIFEQKLPRWFRHWRIKKKQRNGSDLLPLSGQFWKHAWAGSAASSLNAASSITSPCMMETWKRSGLENCLLMFIVFFTVNATNILTKVLFFKGGVGHDEWVQPRSLFGMLLRVHQSNHLSVCSHPAERQAFGGQKVENQFCVQTGFLLFLFSERCKQDRNGKKDVGSWAPWLRSFKRSLIFLHLQLQGLLRWGCAEWLLQAIWRFPGMSDKNGWMIQSEVSQTKKMKSSLAVFPCFSPFHTGYVVFNICFSSSFFVGSLATSTKTLIGVCGWRTSIQFLLQLLVIQKLQHHSPSRKMLKGTCQMMQLAFQLQQLHLFVNHPPWPKLSSSLNLLAKSQLWWHWAWVLGKLSHAIWWTTRPSWVQAPTLEYLEQPPRTHDPCSCMQEAHGSQIRPRWGFPIWFFSSPNLIWSNCLSSWISNFSIFLSAGKGLFVETSQWEQSSWVQDSWSWWVGFPALNCSLRFFCWSFPSPSVSNLQTQQEIFSDKLS